MTREQPGDLTAMLESRGALVVHVPLIALEDPDDGGVSLNAYLGELDTFDWLVVTSAAGASRIGTAAAYPHKIRLAAVGAATARVLSELASRDVDLVPAVQTARALADELIRVVGNQQCRILVAQADIAADDLVETLRSAGHQVTACVAYRTVLRHPDPTAIQGADAVVFTSGSAARGWAQAVGSPTPSIVVVIGPSTAAVALEVGLKVSGVAADHTLEGLVTELERQFSTQSPIVDG